MKQTTKKTPEAIMKANLAKTLGRMKTKVADREDLWLELFSSILGITMTAYYDNNREGLVKDHVLEASSVADWALDAYEERWGKG